jgi:hypothetical protein
LNGYGQQIHKILVALPYVQISINDELQEVKLSTLARQGGGSIQDLHWSFILGLFSVLGCSDLLGEVVGLGGFDLIC